MLLILSHTISNELILGEKVVKIVVVELDLTYDNIRSQMTENGLKHPEILMKQIKLETGNLKRIKGNNLFGFRKDDYLSFDTWVDCIKFAKVWQDKRYKGGNYYAFLVKINYAEDSLYIEKLKRIR
jgi:hypothetical protein